MKPTQLILAALLVPAVAVGRLLRPARRRRPPVIDRAYMERLDRAEREGDDAFIERELARLQPTAEQIRRTTRPSPTSEEWPDEDLVAMFGPEIAALAGVTASPASPSAPPASPARAG